MKKISKPKQADTLKTYDITYRCEVKRAAVVMASSEEEARAKFDSGDFEDIGDLDCYGIDDVSIQESI